MILIKLSPLLSSTSFPICTFFTMPTTTVKMCYIVPWRSLLSESSLLDRDIELGIIIYSKPHDTMCVTMYPSQPIIPDLWGSTTAFASPMATGTSLRQISKSTDEGLKRQQSHMEPSFSSKLSVSKASFHSMKSEPDYGRKVAPQKPVKSLSKNFNMSSYFHSSSLSGASKSDRWGH